MPDLPMHAAAADHRGAMFYAQSRREARLSGK